MDGLVDYPQSEGSKAVERQMQQGQASAQVVSPDGSEGVVQTAAAQQPMAQTTQAVATSPQGQDTNTSTQTTQPAQQVAPVESSSQPSGNPQIPDNLTRYVKESMERARVEERNKLFGRMERLEAESAEKDKQIKALQEKLEKEKNKGKPEVEKPLTRDELAKLVSDTAPAAVQEGLSQRGTQAPAFDPATYKQQLIQSGGSEIIPELIEMAGDSKEAIDEAFQLSKLARARYVQPESKPVTTQGQQTVVPNTPAPAQPVQQLVSPPSAVATPVAPGNQMTDGSVVISRNQAVQAKLADLSARLRNAPPQEKRALMNEFQQLKAEVLRTHQQHQPSVL